VHRLRAAWHLAATAAVRAGVVAAVHHTGEVPVCVAEHPAIKGAPKRAHFVVKAPVG